MRGRLRAAANCRAAMIELFYGLTIEELRHCLTDRDDARYRIREDIERGYDERTVKTARDAAIREVGRRGWAFPDPTERQDG